MFVLCYCISFHHFNVFVENFTSYVTIVFVCWCHGLRLPDLNKETTCLLTYLYPRKRYFTNGQFRKFYTEYHSTRKSDFAQILAQRIHMDIHPQTNQVFPSKLVDKTVNGRTYGRTDIWTDFGHHNTIQYNIILLESCQDATWTQWSNYNR